MEYEDLEESAEQELKRADHLMYVTLKYSRTAEVIKSVIKRLINAYDFAVLEALKFMKVKDISDVPRRRVKQLEEKLPQFKQDVKMYLLMRELDAASFKGREEYRKNVTLVTPIMEVNVPRLQKFFEKTILFVKEIEVMVKTKKK